MPQNYSGRIGVILAVLVVALVAVMWPSVTNPGGVLFNKSLPFSAKHNLRPGIDIVGGTSLIYEIKQPPGAGFNPNLAQDVVRALKERIDPRGVMNLVWRPQGANRLEIQMPLSGRSGASERQKTLADAQAALEATNIVVPQVTAQLRQGDVSDAELDKLAAGSPARRKLLGELREANQAYRAAEQRLDAAAANAAEDRITQLEEQLKATNVTGSHIDRILELGISKEQKLAELKAQVAPFPAQAQAVEKYLAARAALEQGGGAAIDSAADLKRLLRGSGVLEFHIVPRSPQTEVPNYADWHRRLLADGPRYKPGDNYRWFEVDRPTEFEGRTEVYNDRHWMLASMRMEDSLDKRHGAWKLEDARATSDPKSNENLVRFDFDADGGRLFGDLTRKHVQKPMAIMLDGRVISAPIIQTAITGGTGTINGGSDGFTSEELDYLVRTLSAGSLPAQLDDEPISERTVGPQLGEDNLRAGLVACLLGLVVVGIFLVGYYYLAGLVAYFAVLLNLLIILGAMAAMNATFTLPSIAAVVLTVGSAVDSNVLIFERLREEQMRGLGIRMALRNAYDRAFSAILDSNVTALITSLFLILFGTEEVKGFGITLVVGILASLFTALFVTKTIFGLLVDKARIKRLGSIPMSFPKWDRMLRPNIDWMKSMKWFFALSFIIIALGTFLFVRYFNAGQILDIEFTSGTAVTFELREPQDQTTVRKWIESAGENVIPSASVVRIGEEGTVWEITTPNENGAQVRDAIIAAVGTHLKAELPSSFTGDNLPAGAAMARPDLVLPLTAENLADAGKWPGGEPPAEARGYVGGAAIFLRDLRDTNPRLSAEQIAARVRRQVLQLREGQEHAFTGDWTVVAPQAVGNNKPTETAIVLVNDPEYPFDAADAKKREQWELAVVTPMWSLAVDAVTRPPVLQQVKNFDKSVSNDVTQDALIALTLSILVIMAYIWFRFGNLKYGTATVIALLHDVLFTIAGLGLAHLLSGQWIGDALQLQPFRINLTIVAGILTVMGYSMLDTIVVFDRIRELRGKYGHLSPQVINDAINQTLSRTLLTAGTTIVSLMIMYFIGGQGIHGFTFVLLIGILVGTYSSIVIASPILLIGGERVEEKAAKRPAGKLQRAGT